MKPIRNAAWFGGSLLISCLFLFYYFGTSRPGKQAAYQVKPDSLKKLFMAWKKLHPAERLFLHHDKPLYQPGETVWFSVFLAEEASLSRPSVSEIAYVEILNPKGSIEKTYNLIARGGKADGDFGLPEDAPGGVWKFKAYTRWSQSQNREYIREFQVQEVSLPTFKLSLDWERQAYKTGDKAEARFEAFDLNNQALAGARIQIDLQAGDQNLYHEEASTNPEGKFTVRFPVPALPGGSKPVLNIQIFRGDETESISRSLPLSDPNLLVSLFPEGGDFIQNRNTRMAFMVRKPDSTSADAEGWLVNQRNEKLQLVRTFHRGMGSFRFTPKAGESYTIEWNGGTRTALPEPLETGFFLQAETGENDIQVEAGAPANDALLLVAQMRGKWLWEKRSASSKQISTRIPVSDWPAGVVKLSLFDGRGLLRCERMVFVNARKQLKVSIKTDKERYQPRERITGNIRVTDHKGIPVPGLVSLAVVNDALLSLADDKQGNLVSSWLLEQDLDAKLEEPKFYFSNQPKASEALDLVMLTYGWRGLSWKQVLEEPLEKSAVRPEKAVIAGTVMNAMENRPLPNARLTYGKRTIYADTNGHFKLPFVDLSKPLTLQISDGKKGQIQSETITAYSDEMVLYYNAYPVVYEKMIPMAAMADGNFPEMNAADAKVMRRGNRAQPMPAPVPKKAVNPRRKMDEERKAIGGAPVPPGRFAPKRGPGFMPPVVEPPAVVYHLKRSFPNLPPPKSTLRTDFRTTLFWSGIMDLDLNGRAPFAFFAGDDVSSYRITAQASGPDGLLGEGQDLFYTELPFSISAKLPVEISLGDEARLSVMVKNKTAQNQTFKLNIQLPAALKSLSTPPGEVLVAAGKTKEILLPVSALAAGDSNKIRLEIGTGQDVDTWERNLRIVPRGYPVHLSFSGRSMKNGYYAQIEKMVPGSLKVHATAFPDVTSDLLKGVESILAEPFGCFEQTSMTSYPNVLVLNYLKQSSQPNPTLVSNAEVLLEKGYKKLTSFETKQKGYEWFGGTPAHEALSAYGLMQFTEMKRHASYVDQAMIDRTRDWLLSRRDGKGGFLRSAQALDNFGRANEDVTNAYIVYSLAEAGSQQLDLEVKKVTDKALETKDPYQLALVANTLWLLKQTDKAREVTALLTGLQKENGSWVGLTHSITYSTGQALEVETTGFSILALIRSGEADKARIDKAVSFLCQQRQGGGGFGNSQSTIVALKALTSYVVYSKRAAEDGAFSLRVNDQDAGKMDWKAGLQKAISLGGWEKLLVEGRNRLEFDYSVLTDPLPFTLGIDYFTSLPPNDPACKVELQTSLSHKQIELGKPVQLKVMLKNKTPDGLPMTMVCLSIPGGTSASPVTLRELMEKKEVDFYETRGNKIFLYYRQLKPGEIRNITLTLNTLVKGRYESSAASAYLYYTAERKTWQPGLPLEIQ